MLLVEEKDCEFGKLMKSDSRHGFLKNFVCVRHDK